MVSAWRNNNIWRHYFTLCKPRIVLLMLLTAWTGMYLGAQTPISWALWLCATAGIGLMCASAAVVNHIIDYRTDAIMERTKHRPLASGKLSRRSAWIFALILGMSGFVILFFYVNALTAWLTLAAAIGYGAVYSLYLKQATSQNIVIGGLASAMPPLLGWTAVTDQLQAQGWLLVLIIFAWTPAHSWALYLHRYHEYKQTTIPMLPMTHGISFTKFNIMLYSLLTIACSLLPYAIGMSGLFYLVSAVALGAGFVGYAVRLQFASDGTGTDPSGQRLALKTFHYSLIYLTGLFLVILLDHHLLVT